MRGWRSIATQGSPLGCFLNEDHEENGAQIMSQSMAISAILISIRVNGANGEIAIILLLSILQHSKDSKKVKFTIF